MKGNGFENGELYVDVDIWPWVKQRFECINEKLFNKQIKDFNSLHWIFGSCLSSIEEVQDCMMSMLLLNNKELTDIKERFFNIVISKENPQPLLDAIKKYWKEFGKNRSCDKNFDITKKMQEICSQDISSNISFNIKPALPKNGGPINSISYLIWAESKGCIEFKLGALKSFLEKLNIERVGSDHSNFPYKVKFSKIKPILIKDLSVGAENSSKSIDELISKYTKENIGYPVLETIDVMHHLLFFSIICRTYINFMKESNNINVDYKGKLTQYINSIDAMITDKVDKLGQKITSMKIETDKFNIDKSLHERSATLLTYIDAIYSFYDLLDEKHIINMQKNFDKYLENKLNKDYLASSIFALVSCVIFLARNKLSLIIAKMHSNNIDHIRKVLMFGAAAPLMFIACVFYFNANFEENKYHKLLAVTKPKKEDLKYIIDYELLNNPKASTVDYAKARIRSIKNNPKGILFSRHAFNGMKKTIFR